MRAKFKCNSVLNLEGGHKEANLNAVYGDNGENADFTQFTPNGDLKMQISPDTKANSFFTPGDSYYLDFSKAE